MRLINTFILFFIGFSCTAQSVLWQINHTDIEHNSYLLGTIHSTNKAIDSITKLCYPYLDSTQKVALELIPDSHNMMSLMPHLIMPNGVEVQGYLTGKEFAKLDSLLIANVGIGAAVFNKVYPIFLSSFLGGQQSQKNNITGSVDLDILKYARENGKGEMALETPEQQIKALTSIRFQYQIDILKELLNDTLQTTDNETDQLFELYENQQIDSIYNFIKKADFSAEEMSKLLDYRNRVMLHKILNSIKNESIFIAVGIGHLGGQMGLISLLKENGFTLTPIELKK